MKSLWPLAIIVIVAAASAVLITFPAEADGGDSETDTFTIEGVEYEVLFDHYVAVSLVDLNLEGHLNIPNTVEYEGTTYIVTTIETLAIPMGSKLTSVTIPANVTKIESGAIVGGELESIEVDYENPIYESVDGVLYANGGATLVSSPAKKTSVAVSTKVTEIEQRAFYSGSLESIWIYGNVSIIQSETFANCRHLREINMTMDGVNTMPSSVLIIEDSAFSNCESLQNISLNNVRTIGMYAFSNTGLETINITEAVVNVADGAFIGCQNLRYFESENEFYPVEEGVLYEKRSILSLKCYPAGKTDESLTIPAEADTISPWAFSGCSHLKNVKILDQAEVSYAAFSECSSLEYVYMWDGVLYIDAMAFSGCSALKGFQANGLVGMGMLAFSETGLESVVFPATLRVVMDAVFMGCINMVSAEFGENLEYLGGDAFYHTQLSEVTITSDKVELAPGCMNVGGYDTPKAHTVLTIQKGVEVPENIADEDTELVIVRIGDRPYPVENLPVVGLCIAILVGIIYYFRRVRT